MAARADAALSEALKTGTLKRHVLGKEHEARIQVGDHANAQRLADEHLKDAASSLAGRLDTCAYVQLISGNAEVFGCELAQDVTYTFPPGRKFAIFSWYACEVHVWGNVSSSYVSEESNMPMYAALHGRLEARREDAKHGGAVAAPGGALPPPAPGTASVGPRVMLVGPTNAGKSTLSRILCSYACRTGRCPTFIDLDIGQGEVSVPGSVAATPLDKLCLSVEDGFTRTVPLTYYFGHDSPSRGPDVYKHCVERLADCVSQRMAGDDAARASGCVINTMGWIEALGYELLLHAIKAFEADVIVVLGNDKLFATLVPDVKELKFPFRRPRASDAATASATGAAANMKAVTVIKFPSSSSVVERSAEVRAAARAARIREYFYGPERPSGIPPLLSPAALTVGFDDVTVVTIGGGKADSSILPIGQSSTLDPLRVNVITIQPRLARNLLGVSFATTEKQIPHANVAGYVHVTAVNMDTRTLTLLVPSAGPLPSKFLILGSITWME